MQERQEVLVTELQHRTFNLLGTVQAIADTTLRSSSSLDDFQCKFRDRLRAIARVQRLLSRLDRNSDRVTFDELISSEIAAIGSDEEIESRVTLDGPSGIALRSSTVQTLAMALHELATNALKYGALKQSGAKLDVQWTVDTDTDNRPWLHVDWRERNVALPITDPDHMGRGQGRTLIEKALPYQLGAKTTYEINTDGIRCTIALPVSSPGQTKEKA